MPDNLEDTAVDIALTLPPADCRRLAAAATDGPAGLRRFERSTAGTLVRHAAQRLLAVWGTDHDPAEVAGLLRGASAGVAKQRAHQTVDVVWTGPDSGLSTSRTTETVVAELVDQARVSLLLVSYNVTPYAKLDRALRAAADRGVEIILLLERPADNASFHAARRDPFPGLPALRWAWPAVHRPPGAALHAKLIVVDDEIAFVSSANLSGRATTDNLECGLLIRGGPTATTIRRYLTTLFHSGRLISSS